ncbi:AMP phosphorylase [Patescibacteria group bacterium]|nr:AMP phosphorylase [Patescibacteria group bacterium]
MKLIPRKIPIKVGNKFVAVLSKTTAHKFDLHAGDRIQIKNGHKGDLRAILDVSENGEIDENEIGLFSEPWKKLKTKRGDRITVTIADKPISLVYIREKLDGKKLSPEKYNEIIKDVVEDDLSDVEMAYFVSGCYKNGMTDDETVALTRSIVKNGGRLKFKKRIVMDKHCIGGVPGNRTTMIVVPIVAAAGLIMPKTSSRAITSPAGTADTMEVLANVKNDAKRLQQIANRVGGFITWGGGVDLAAADDHMIRVRNPLSLDPQGMLLASIMAKKFSVSANRVLIDIPCGPQVKVKKRADAIALGNKFKLIGRKLGMKVQILISNGEQPIGNGIGPVLEARDVLKVLACEKDAPKDLREKGLKMAGILLELGEKAKKGQGYKKAKDLLDSGKANKKFMQMIKAQGEQRIAIREGEFAKHVLAKKTGKVVGIHNKLVARIARTAGAPVDKQAGVYLYKKLGDKVKKGEKLFTIYADNKERLKNTEIFGLDNAYTVK